jgi:hypothetical protein
MNKLKNKRDAIVFTPKRRCSDTHFENENPGTQEEPRI